MTTPFERLSKRQRCLTPLALCWWLTHRVMCAYQCERVAALWCADSSPYMALWPHVDCWTKRRDARLYDGPWPVVAHPPCGPWGRCKGLSRESRAHGVRAMELVHRFGGVVEQPVGSELFRLHGDGRAVQRINQGAWGFPTPKPTMLYWV